MLCGLTVGGQRLCLPRMRNARTYAICAYSKGAVTKVTAPFMHVCFIAAMRPACKTQSRIPRGLHILQNSGFPLVSIH